MDKNGPSIKSFFAFIIAFALALNAFSQNWDIPADKKAKNSYLPFNAENSKAGEALFTKNCQSCHGNPGKGNSLKTLQPIPPDLASKQTSERTDGDLFYIISTGKMVMPSFKNIFSEEERWKLIAFIRSFHKGYVQVLSKTDPSKSKLVKVNMSFDSLSGKISVVVTADEKTGSIPLKNDEVSLFANRYFGKLQIGKTQNTNEQGKTTFAFPKDLPGDKNGMVELMVSVNDDIYGEVEYMSKMKVARPTDMPPLNEKRAIWNVLTKAPMWIILLYTGLVLGVGAVLLYIGYLLKKIYASGKSISSES